MMHKKEKIIRKKSKNVLTLVSFYDNIIEYQAEGNVT